MVDRVCNLGPNCNIYKLDLSCGYRQLCLDPIDWPLLPIENAGKYHVDICLPFGLRTAALMVERTTMSIFYIHRLYGCKTNTFKDDIVCVKAEYHEASDGLLTQSDAKLISTFKI